MNATGCSPSFNAAGIYTLGLFTGTGICVFHFECERATERKTVKEGPGQRLNVCVVCVCVFNQGLPSRVFLRATST